MRSRSKPKARSCNSDKTAKPQELKEESLDAACGGFLIQVSSEKEASNKPLSGTDLGSGRVK